MNNPIHLKIGILAAVPEWISLLDQIGVDWTSLESVFQLTPNSFSVLIVNRPITSIEIAELDHYVRSGGAVLFTPEEEQQILKKSTSRRFIFSLAPQNRNEYCYTDILDLYNNAYVFDRDSLTATDRIENGLNAYLGINIPLLYSDTEAMRRGFYARRSRLPNEIVAKRSRSSVRQIVQSFLEFLHHSRNLPFVHKWFYPSDHQTLFTFRIDSDKGTQLQIEEIFRLSELYSIPTTWFLDVKSHELWLKYFTKFKTQEIGVHCYDHTVSKSKALNRENFDKALCLLRHQGMDPHGIAAPTGAWNSGLGKAFQELGLEYSSEFAYNYDDLPSYPIIDGSFSPVVQLPVHPCCIGNMRREQMSSQEMMEYFLSVINHKILCREPVCLYHHPGHGTNEVFQEVFRYINSKHLLKLSYGEYARWWKRRQSASFSAQVEDGSIALEGQYAGADTYVRISLRGGKEAFLLPSGTVRVDELQWHEAPAPPDTPHDILRTRERNIRHYIHNALDWWIKTTE